MTVSTPSFVRFGRGILMNHRTVCTVVVLILAFAFSYPMGRTATSAAAPMPQPAVLVELFTSEGCSDCPPADQVLAQLARNHLIDGVEVVAMSEHVDYWNRLGWSDPFSDAQFSDRQNEYAHAFRRRDIYTPQMVVDGEIDFVGSNKGQALEAVARAAKKSKALLSITRMNVDKETVRVRIHVDSVSKLTGTEPADVYLAITEDNLSSKVDSGENRGRKLEHVAVVRRLTRIGNLSVGAVYNSEYVARIDKAWKRGGLRAVAFAQDKKNRRVLAVSSTSVEGSE
jgi:hypothetical protein